MLLPHSIPPLQMSIKGVNYLGPMHQEGHSGEQQCVGLFDAKISLGWVLASAMVSSDVQALPPLLL